MIDQIYDDLVAGLPDAKLYLGSEHLDEQFAAPKVVVQPLSVDLTQAKSQAGRGDVPVAAAGRSLDLQIYCYALGPKYQAVEDLWESVIAALTKLDLQFDQGGTGAPQSLIRYSTDVPGADTHRVAVITLTGVQYAVFDEPTVVVPEIIAKEINDSVYLRIGDDNG